VARKVLALKSMIIFFLWKWKAYDFELLTSMIGLVCMWHIELEGPSSIVI
jgi:hypothetical protein